MNAFLVRLAMSVFAIAVTASLAAAQSMSAVRVASKIDTEGSLLGNIVILALEAKGIKTENRLQLGTTKILRGAITSGEIDIYPEYTGNGAFFFGDEGDPVWKNAKAGFEKVKALDFETNRIVWLTPAPANNTWAIAVREDVAATHALKSLADLGKWISAGGRFKLAASAEFVERSDALPAFESAYDFKLPLLNFEWVDRGCFGWQTGSRATKSAKRTLDAVCQPVRCRRGRCAMLAHWP